MSPQIMFFYISVRIAGTKLTVDLATFVKQVAQSMYDLIAKLFHFSITLAVAYQHGSSNHQT